MLLAFIDCLTLNLHNIAELLVVHKMIYYPHTIINNAYHYITTIHGIILYIYHITIHGTILLFFE